MEPKKQSEKMRSAGIEVRFATNTDSKSVKTLKQGLAEFGVEADDREIFSPVVATLQYIGKLPDCNTVALVSQELQPMFSPYFDKTRPVTHVVVGDFRDQVSYVRINEIYRFIVDNNAQIIALQKGRFFHNAEGRNVDTGAFVSMFEYAADATAMVMGKPSSSFFLQAIESIGCAPEEVVVVGDDITTDIQGAGAVGAMSVLVRTGKYSDETLAKYPQIKPTQIIDSLGSLPGLVGL